MSLSDVIKEQKKLKKAAQIKIKQTQKGGQVKGKQTNNNIRKPKGKGGVNQRQTRRWSEENAEQKTKAQKRRSDCRRVGQTAGFLPCPEVMIETSIVNDQCIL